MLNERIRGGYGQTLARARGARGRLGRSRAVEPRRRPGADPPATSAAEFLADPRPLTARGVRPGRARDRVRGHRELQRAIGVIDGQLTATVQAVDDDPDAARVLPLLAERAGRVLVNGWPTGVSVTWAMQHGGPYPATTSVQTTSVGTAAIDRFLRARQRTRARPRRCCPEPLPDGNPWGLPRRIDGVQER